MKITIIKSEAKLTRPNDTTAYTLGDAISNSTSAPTTIQFERVSGTAGRFVRVSRLTINKTGVSVPSLQLWLFTKNVTATNDNSAFSLTDADNINTAAVINLYTVNTAVNNSFYDSGEISVDIELDSAETKLYGLIKTMEDFTPEAQEVFRLTLQVQNLD